MLSVSLLTGWGTSEHLTLCNVPSLKSQTNNTDFTHLSTCSMLMHLLPHSAVLNAPDDHFHSGVGNWLSPGKGEGAKTAQSYLISA